MESILQDTYNVHFGDDIYMHLIKQLKTKKPSKVFILCDSNTYEHCIPVFLQNLPTDLPIEILQIEPGESHKDLETCTQLYEALLELECDRKSYFINVGGGVVTDIGGFIASTIKRGIGFTHVPTTLLGMVDAAIGGKNGVNLGKIKNQIGVINPPEMVLIHTDFLATLPQAEMRSGLAEMLKHGLIADAMYFEHVSNLDEMTTDDLESLIYRSVEIKTRIVAQDVNELGMRKALNFGHTLGHAIESFSHESNEIETLLHGDAVAIGSIMACYISKAQLGFSSCDKIKEVLLSYFPQVSIPPSSIPKILEYLKHDKKNINGIAQFVLLESIGSFKVDQQVPEETIIAAFDYYRA